MNSEDYIDKKAKGLVSLVKAGGGFAIAVQKFSPDTGEQLSDEITSVDVEELTNQKKALQNEISDIDTFIADINSLK